MSIVTLSDTECTIATIIGHRRREISTEKNRASRRDLTADGLDNDIESSAAELAVAKYYNIYPEWSPTMGAVPQFDLRLRGQRLDVKHTDRPDGNLLIPKLIDSLIYVLVCGRMPVKNIIGSLQGSLVRERGTWREDMALPCWFVPAIKLNLIKEEK